MSVHTARQEQAIQQVMTERPACCAPEDTIGNVARMMLQHHCSAIPVVDSHQTGFLIGIITDGDIVRRVVATDRSPIECQVREVMTPEPTTLRRDATISQCIHAIASRRVRHIPIVDDRGKVTGIVTPGDLARASQSEPALEHELAEMIEELT
jgi:CBS domain-containing protein